VVDVFVDNLDLAALGFDRAIAQATGRPGYHPATLLKIYIYGYPQEQKPWKGSTHAMQGEGNATQPTWCLEAAPR